MHKSHSHVVLCSWPWVQTNPAITHSLARTCSCVACKDCRALYYVEVTDQVLELRFWFYKQRDILRYSGLAATHWTYSVLSTHQFNRICPPVRSIYSMWTVHPDRYPCVGHCHTAQPSPSATIGKGFQQHHPLQGLEGRSFDRSIDRMCVCVCATSWHSLHGHTTVSRTKPGIHKYKGNGLKVRTPTDQTKHSRWNGWWLAYGPHLMLANLTCYCMCCAPHWLCCR